MITVNCQLNSLEDKVYPDDSGQWDSLSSWDDWTTWYIDSPTTINWLSQIYEFGIPIDFNLILETNATGSVEYEIYTSNTGAFAGEETTTTISQGATDVPGFNGAFCRVGVKITKTSERVNTLNSIQITFNRQTITDRLVDIDTSTLRGTITSRRIFPPRKYSKISDVIVSAHEINAYNLDLYVSNYPTSKTLIPRVVDKNRAGPAFALLGIDGSNKDGVVDVEITGLPRQYMVNNNLLNE